MEAPRDARESHPAEHGGVPLQSRELPCETNPKWNFSTGDSAFSGMLQREQMLSLLPPRNNRSFPEDALSPHDEELNTKLKAPLKDATSCV